MRSGLKPKPRNHRQAIVMERQFDALPIHELGEGAGLRRPLQALAARVTLGSPALEVMTDLARAAAATIRPQAPVEGANKFMISRGVRLLVVVDEHENVVGVLTATDILGEKMMRVTMERGVPRGDLVVADIMTPAAKVEVLALADVEAARVGHVLETLRRAGRQHALVVDFDVLPPRGLIDPPVRRTMVRGIFSISQVARQLGVSLQSVGEVARTFSEIEAALGG
jgi:CBS domain-containing protein